MMNYYPMQINIYNSNRLIADQSDSSKIVIIEGKKKILNKILLDVIYNINTNF